MIIARDKKQNNIAEYVLYIWQIEDLIRAHDFNIEKIEANIVRGFDQPGSVRKEIKDWYANLIVMMHEEGIMKKGHLLFIKNTVNELHDLHLRLLHHKKDAAYIDQYRGAKVNIDEFERKTAQKSGNEIETCFNGLYGLLLLRLQKKQICTETTNAMSTFSNLLAILSQRYKQMEEGELEL